MLCAVSEPALAPSFVVTDEGLGKTPPDQDHSRFRGEKKHLKAATTSAWRKRQTRQDPAPLSAATEPTSSARLGVESERGDLLGL